MTTTTAAAVFTAGRGRQLADDGLEADGGDVSQLLFVGQHVGAQRVHDGLHLVLLHLAHQRAQAAAKRTTFIRSDDKESVQVAREEKTRER